MPRTLPRVNLATLPTPTEFLPRLTAILGGPRIYIKRDDLTGLAGGGNKARKLEYLVADAQSRNADTLVTLGSPQSNHCRQTAAAAAKMGMRCILVLRGHPPSGITGNLLLDHLLGAAVRWSGSRSREEVFEDILAEEAAAGRRPYAIPLGGSNGVGSAAYVLAMEELKQQWASVPGNTGTRLDRILFASSSGGTHAGMVVGAFLTSFDGEVLGISIDEELQALREMVSGIASEAASLLGSAHRFVPDDILANADYLGGGYGVMAGPEREAIELFARHEGVLLDPVYTGRAAAGMIGLIRRGVIGKNENILFWHTGGTPALYAYADQLL